MGDFIELKNNTNKKYFLELVRSLSAIYVFLYHLQQQIFFIEPFKILFSFGQEAVMFFFILSGFVIYYSVEKKQELSVYQYIKARIIRIYPVFIIACILTYICQSLIENQFLEFPVISFLKNILMLQDFSTGKPGVWISCFMGNAPLWSLSYEWWFYMLFIPLYFYIDKKKQGVIVSGISITAMIVYLYYPNQISLWLSYFIIWWAGAEIAKKYSSQNHSQNNICLIGIAMFVIFLLLLLFTFINHEVIRVFGMFPILFIRHFFISIVFFLFLSKVDVFKIQIRKNNLFVKFAPYTYAVYVFHFPLLVLFVKKGWLHNLLGVLILIVLILAMAIFSEDGIQKEIIKWTHKKNK